MSDLNPFERVSLVRTRARQLVNGAEPRVPARYTDSAVTIAVKELDAGRLRPDVARRENEPAREPDPTS